MKLSDTIRVWWRYDLKEGECRAQRRIKAALEVNGRLHEGEATCNPADTFERVRGRKIALARALETFPRSFRASIWAELKRRGVRLS